MSNSDLNKTINNLRKTEIKANTAAFTEISIDSNKGKVRLENEQNNVMNIKAKSQQFPQMIIVNNGDLNKAINNLRKTETKATNNLRKTEAKATNTAKVLVDSDKGKERFSGPARNAPNDGLNIKLQFEQLPQMIIVSDGDLKKAINNLRKTKVNANPATFNEVPIHSELKSVFTKGTNDYFESIRKRRESKLAANELTSVPKFVSLHLRKSNLYQKPEICLVNLDWDIVDDSPSGITLCCHKSEQSVSFTVEDVQTEANEFGMI
jgi:hypothetical protein